MFTASVPNVTSVYPRRVAEVDSSDECDAHIPHLIGEPVWTYRVLSTHEKYSDIQGVYKLIVQFQKLTRNLFLTLHGHNVHR